MLSSIENGKKRNIISLVGFIIIYIISTIVFVYLVNNKIIKLPFHRRTSLSDSYMAILNYLPIAIVSCTAFIWIIIAKLPIKDFFKLGKFHPAFYLGLVVSLGYPIIMFSTSKHSFHGPEFIPPIIILSLLNAYGEEIFYRLGLYRLVNNFILNKHIVNIIQSALYAFVHVFLGGSELALMGFVYGLLMGYIFEKSESITPGVICHFLIDLGAIGFPMMIYKYHF